MGQSPIPRYLGNRQIGRNKRLILLPLIFKVKGKGKGQGRLVFSKSPRKSRVRPFVCSKKTFSCYFWRKSNQNVGVGCAIKDAKSRQYLPHKQFQKIPLSPAAVHTPPHPHFGSFLASSLLIGRMGHD